MGREWSDGGSDRRGSGWVQRMGAGGIKGDVQAVGKGAIPNLLIRLLTIWHRKKLTARGSWSTIAQGLIIRIHYTYKI